MSTAEDGAFDENAVDRQNLRDLLADLDEEDRTEPPVEEEISPLGAPREIPEELLLTDPSVGLDIAEVGRRRKTYGFNQMNEKEQSNIKKFLRFFVGPIQSVMEVSRVYYDS